MKHTPQFLRSTLASFLSGLMVFGASFSYADDTEIFFGGPSIDEGIRPNVLFILDNSGSMNWRLDSNYEASSNQLSRLQVLKSSFADIMNSTKDINVGVMVLNSRSEYGSSRYVYPVEYIDKELPDSIELVASNPAIMQSADDATQAIAPAANAVIDSPTLIMGVIDTLQTLPGQVSQPLETTGSFFRQNSSGVEYACRLSPPSRPSSPVCTNGNLTELNLQRSLGTTALFRFSGMSIPANATISNAYIEITPTNSPSNSRRNPWINVRLENNKAAAALSDNNQVGSRTYQNAADTRVNGWISGNRVAIDITDQLIALKGAAPAADPVQSMLVRLTNTNSNNNNTQAYEFCANNCSSGNAPTLVVNYTYAGVAPESRMGALRFQDVGIPQGAQVTAARIDFVPAAANSAAITFAVRAEESGNASAFSNGENLQSRSKTAPISWTPGEWTTPSTPVPVQGPDVSTLVQQVVNRTDWCGNNAMAFYLTPTVGTGSRSAQSFDGSGGLQPQLTISYTGGENGCYHSIIDTRITSNANDGYQNNSGTVNLGASSLPMSRSQIGARFSDLPIARGAEILDAKVIITPAATVANPSQTSLISFQNSASATEFSASNNNFSNRSSRTAESTCSINNATGWVASQPVICDINGLSGSLTSLFASTSWNRGNALNMFIRHTADSTLNAVAYESNPAQSIKLRLKIRNGGLARTVRSHVNALVQNMTAGNNTPVVPTYLDAVNYFRNSVSGRPSPIDSTCQANHIVLLTDGQANDNTTTAKSAIANLTGETCSNDASADGEKCARTLSSWIAKYDQSSVQGDNTITTHTVGFALDASGATTSASIKKFLQDIAANGGGSFSTAENSSELSDAFNRIIQEVLATDTSFVSASAPVNSFERQDNKDELYFSLFRPQETNRWPGNLKRYRFSFFDNDGNLNPRIVDVNNLPAVNPVTGQFADNARSFWSSSADGNNTEAGGAASVLPLSSTRKLFTHIGTSPVNSAALSVLRSDNAAVTQALLGANDADERIALINYIRGLNPDTSAERKALGDPIHSSPRLATYSCATEVNGQCTVADQTAFIGSNEGYLHAFNTTTGQEQFAFMPQELLQNIRLLRENKKSSVAVPRRYGLDNPVTLWINDLNNDGKVFASTTDTEPQTNEFIYAYVTMGRGGRNLYALDVTKRNAPRMLWFIKGGETAGFERLGQTWSVPVKTKIKIGSTPTDVLIFAGGYDETQDNPNTVSTRKTDNMGNSIYIVNATTGALIWSASNTTGHTRVLSNMQYSMPGTPRVVDLQTSPSGALGADQEKLADQIFIGDMGGQIWRFFINNGNSGANLVIPGGSSGNGVFAAAIPANYDALSLADQKQNLRRFYNEPDVALLNRDGTLSLSVNIGSGYRGHPLDKNAQDYFYSFRTNNVAPALNASATQVDEGTILESHMVDITTNLTPDTVEQQKQLSLKDGRAKGGWYIKFSSTSGEKVLTRALSAGQDNVLFFNTYQPGSNTNSCKAAFGISRSYAISLFDGSPYVVAGDTAQLSDRYTSLTSTGLPPQPELICIGSHCAVIRDKDKPTLVDVPAPGKMYWIDRTDVD